jgi:hypothetical protein
MRIKENKGQQVLVILRQQFVINKMSQYNLIFAAGGQGDPQLC